MSQTFPPPVTTEEPLIRMENITKRFPGVIANQNVRLNVRSGSFHAVIGENGAGKSTLLNILYGRYRPDAGRIFLRGEEVTTALRSPSDAIRRGIALVSQHYALIPALSVLENIILGSEPTLPIGTLALGRAKKRIAELADQLDLAALDFSAPAGTLSVAAQQKVEILKALYRGAQILLLDEPTATLAPQEADSLFALLKTLAAKNATIVFVTHKLREVMAHSDQVTVLRAGRNVGDFDTHMTNEQELLFQMIGARGSVALQSRVPLTGVPEPPLPAAPSLPIPTPNSSPMLQVENVSVRSLRRAEVLKNIRMEVAPGEIVGVAGVDGSGQRELAEAIIGLQPLHSGRFFLSGVEFTRYSVRQREEFGIAYIPEDRHRDGMILDFTLSENYLMGHQRRQTWGGGWTLNPARMASRAADMIRRYDVRVGTGGPKTLARTLSGGNQQKVVFARAMESTPRLLIACQPTRGLDVNAAQFVYKTLEDARADGLGILLFSLDLDEIFLLADRIAVMFNGQIVGVLPKAEATPESVGALMTGAGQPPTDPIPETEPGSEAAL